MQQHNAALVLSGGAALGAAHLGVVQVLQEHGVEFDFYAGVSAGALVAAALACGKSAVELIGILEKTRLMALAFDFSGSLHGLLRGKKVKALLDRLYEGRRFEDLPVKLYVGVTDFVNGDRVLLTSGSLADAVRASVSVPLFFEPYYHPGAGRWFVDGGLTQNLPLDVAVEQYRGARIFACDVCSCLKAEADFSKKSWLGGLRNLKNNAERSLRIIFRTQQRHLPQDTRVVKIVPDLAEFNGIDAHRLKVITERGRQAARCIMGDGLPL